MSHRGPRTSSERVGVRRMRQGAGRPSAAWAARGLLLPNGGDAVGGGRMWRCLDILILAAGARSGSIFVSGGSGLRCGVARRRAATTGSMERVLAELALQGAGSPLVSRLDTMEDHGVRTMLAFPILYHDEPVGVFVAGFDRDCVLFRGPRSSFVLARAAFPVLKVGSSRSLPWARPSSRRRGCSMSVGPHANWSRDLPRRSSWLTRPTLRR